MCDKFLRHVLNVSTIASVDAGAYIFIFVGVYVCSFASQTSIGWPFRPLLWRWRKMAALPLPIAILNDLISGSANEVIQDEVIFT